MTRTPDCTLSDRLVELIADEGFDALPDLMRIMINAAMQAERQQHLQAAPYERTEERRGYAQVRDAAVLIAMGITADGKRTILGVSVSVSEQEVHWRQFLQSLLARGLSGVQLITSDAHTSLQAARVACFGGAHGNAVISTSSRTPRRMCRARS